MSFASRRPQLVAQVSMALVLLAFAAPAMGAAQTARPAAAKLDAERRAQVVRSLCDQVREHYVEPDTARMIADLVAARLKAGAYEQITEPTAFAEAVTQDLRRVNGDLHLSLRFDPEGGSLDAGPRIVRREGPPGGGSGGGAPVVVRDSGPPPGGAGGGAPVVVHERGPRPGGAGGPDAGPNAPWMREAVEKNFGLGRAEILPGNIGYLEITGFMEAPGMEKTLVAALEFLEHTDAMIVDVRRNGGGSGGMSHLVFSHFLGETPVPTIRVKSREEGMSREQQSLAEVPGPRRPDVPLYVLTSRNTGSAAEEFSFVLKNLGRATLVGDRTGGAGHMVGMFPASDGFVAGVSITRVSDPRTGLEWEGVGVQPDVRVSAERALDVAHVAALRKVAGAAPERRRAALEMTAEWIENRGRAPAVSADRLAAFAGAYEGDREVWVEGGRLMYRRAGSMGEALAPLGDGRFALLGMARLAFEPGAMTVDRADGTHSTYRRVGAKVSGD